MGRFERICWRITFVAAAAAAIDLIYLFFFIEAGTPQKIGAAAQVGAIVILPYVFARAVQAWGHAGREIGARRKRQHDTRRIAGALTVGGRGGIEPSASAVAKPGRAAEAAGTLQAISPMFAPAPMTRRRGRGRWIVLVLLLILLIFGIGYAYLRENDPALLLRWGLGSFR